MAFDHAALHLRDERPIIYTAISRAMFSHRVLVSKFVLEAGGVPLNPFMNFDFAFHTLVDKDTVLTGNNNMVRIADELWMFGPVSDGCLAEILLASQAGKPVRYFACGGMAIAEIDDVDVDFEDGLDHTMIPRPVSLAIQ